MREYERLRTEGKLSELVTGHSMLKDKLVKDDVTTSSAGDVGSESSISDVQVSALLLVSDSPTFLSSENFVLHPDYSSLIPQYPRIDTQALDHLIKSIMSVSPAKFLEKECSWKRYVGMFLQLLQLLKTACFGRWHVFVI